MRYADRPSRPRDDGSFSVASGPDVRAGTRAGRRGTSRRRPAGRCPGRPTRAGPRSTRRRPARARSPGPRRPRRSARRRPRRPTRSGPCRASEERTSRPKEARLPMTDSSAVESTSALDTPAGLRLSATYQRAASYAASPGSQASAGSSRSGRTHRSARSTSARPFVDIAKFVVRAVTSRSPLAERHDVGREAGVDLRGGRDLDVAGEEAAALERGAQLGQAGRGEPTQDEREREAPVRVPGRRQDAPVRVDAEHRRDAAGRHVGVHEDARHERVVDDGGAACDWARGWPTARGPTATGSARPACSMPRGRPTMPRPSTRTPAGRQPRWRRGPGPDAPIHPLPRALPLC